MARQTYGVMWVQAEGKYMVCFSGGMTKQEARAEKARLNAGLAARTGGGDEAPTPATQQAPDFDGGFGIGGLGRHEETPIIPSVKAIERVQRMHDTDVICRRCGSSKNFDGAMFTTGGGDVCDDCFG
jgi:hypothetical protein